MKNVTMAIVSTREIPAEIIAEVPLVVMATLILGKNVTMATETWEMLVTPIVGSWILVQMSIVQPRRAGRYAGITRGRDMSASVPGIDRSAMPSAEVRGR